MINDIEIWDLLSTKLPVELCKRIVEFAPRHQYIQELKYLKQICWKKHYYMNYEHDYTLFELLLNSRNSYILDFQMLGNTVNFDKFMYEIYLDYIAIYSAYGYVREILEIPNHIIEEYLLQKYEADPYKTIWIHDDFSVKYFSRFRHISKISQQQIDKYIERQEYNDHYILMNIIIILIMILMYIVANDHTERHKYVFFIE